MKAQKASKHKMKVKLIFNPGSGENDKSPVQLMQIIKEMQAWKLVPELFLIEPNCDLCGIVKDAIAQGIRMFVVCGGDGTVSAVARAILGTNAILGIVPTGTQNNVALSLGIPTDIPSAIAILRNGEYAKLDSGIVTCNDVSTPFIEVCSVGLFSNLYPSGDDIQHGDLTRIGGFLATLTASVPSEIHLMLDDKKEIQKLGHVVLISNMPYIGRNYQVGSQDSFDDGFFDVMIFADLSKLDLIGCVIKGLGTSELEDSRIQHFRVRKIAIDTQPAMPVMADGLIIGEGSVQIEIQRQALTVMVAATALNKMTEQGDIIEEER